MSPVVFDPERVVSNRFDSSDSNEEPIVRTGSTQALMAPIREDDVIFAVGESALLALVHESIPNPLVPVNVTAGVPSVPLEDLEDAVPSIGRSPIETKSIPTISVRRGDGQYRALMDVMAVTAEPARISEFQTRGGRADRIIDQVRADGIAVAGPAGTPGYVTAAGGPVLDPSLRGLAVVPVGPFRTEQKHWVLEPPIEIEVVREEVEVALVIDDETVETVPAGSPIEFDWGEPVTVGVLEQSRSSLETDA